MIDKTKAVIHGCDCDSWTLDQFEWTVKQLRHWAVQIEARPEIVKLL